MKNLIPTNFVKLPLLVLAFAAATLFSSCAVQMGCPGQVNNNNSPLYLQQKVEISANKAVKAPIQDVTVAAKPMNDTRNF